MPCLPCAPLPSARQVSHLPIRMLNIIAVMLQVSKKKENSWVMSALVCPASEGSFTGSDGHHPTHNQPPATTPNPTYRPTANTETIDASCLLGSTATRISFSYQKKMLALDMLILPPAQHMHMPWRDIKQLSKAQLSSIEMDLISHSAAPATRAAISL